MAKKKALITGCSGQDGSYLAEFLLEKGYEVHGIIRRTSIPIIARISHLFKNPSFKLHYGDLIDQFSLMNVVKEVIPDEVYNLAAQSFVHVSFDQPYLTREINYHGVIRLTDVLREIVPDCKFYQASTSEMFGNVEESPQNESTAFKPVSPYGISKRDAHLYVKWLREEKGFFGCGGILFNHESPRRGIEFVSKKIINSAIKIKDGKQDSLLLGNLDAKRDWGYAPDYVEAMWLILQQKKPDDYVIATGENHTVREFCEEAFRLVGTEIVWKGKGIDEIGIKKGSNSVIVKIDKSFYRPTDVYNLVGDSTKARKILGWKPRISFKNLIKIMVQDELKPKDN